MLASSATAPVSARPGAAPVSSPFFPLRLSSCAWSCCASRSFTKPLVPSATMSTSAWTGSTPISFAVSSCVCASASSRRVCCSWAGTGPFSATAFASASPKTTPGVSSVPLTSPWGSSSALRLQPCSGYCSTGKRAASPTVCAPSSPTTRPLDEAAPALSTSSVARGSCCRRWCSSSIISPWMKKRMLAPVDLSGFTSRSFKYPRSSR
mmetsp:Transcript_6113/g.22438  ORF Transcript_6113/g.22438 Transcript_6113/m.22438 type:complete len:208 (+) Transcript_6113:1026-1649(+)